MPGSPSEDSGLSSLLADDPIASGAEDAFDRKDFARRAAELIAKVAAETPSAVLGLLGPWGSGKTSCLRMIEESLVDGDGTWTVLRFNPWEVSDLESIVVEFFATLQSILHEEGNGKNAREALSKYASKVAPWAGLLKIVGIDAAGALLSLADATRGDESLDARRRTLEAALTEADLRVLILVDDVDRLHPDELAVLFKLVRLVGRLPNVHYLLAFDERTVLDVLMRTGLAFDDESRALDYMEKILQLRLDLPPLHQRTATRVVDAAFGRLADEFALTISDDDMYRFSVPYYAHMSHRLREPRQIKRLFGQVEAMYPLVQGNVDFIDFVLVTFIRTVHPRAYRELLAHKDELTGSVYEAPKKPLSEQLTMWRGRLVDWGCDAAEVPSLLELLGALFIPIAEATKNTLMNTSGTAERLLASKRVGSALYFDWYFYYAPTPGDVADSVIADAINEALAGHEGAATGAVLLATVAAPESIIGRVEHALPHDPDERRRVVPLVAAVARQVPRESGILGSTSLVGMMLLAKMFVTTDLSNPEKLAADVAARAGAALAADATVMAARSFRENDQEPPEQFLNFRAAILKEVIAALDVEATKPVEETSDVLILLYRWSELSEGGGPRRWLEGHLDQGAWTTASFVALFVPEATSYGDGIAPRRSFASMDLLGLDGLLGVDNAIDRLGDSLSAPTAETETLSGGPNIENEGKGTRFARRVEIAREALLEARSRGSS